MVCSGESQRVTHYDVPAHDGALLQGEIVAGVYEHRALHPPVALEKDFHMPFRSIGHAYMVVMNPICDLEQDFKARFEEGHMRNVTPKDIDDSEPACVPHVLLCDAYTRDKIRPRILGRDLWRRLDNNQDERYHHLASGSVVDYLSGCESQVLPDLYLDFRKTLALPCGRLYDGILSGGIKRIAVLPRLHTCDLAHRYSAFLARVGLPDQPAWTTTS